MTANTLYVAFPESAALSEETEAFLRAVEANPNADLSDQLRRLVDHLVEEIVTTYFDGPIDATGAQGGMVNVIHRAANVIRKTAGGMAGRMAGKVKPGAQVQAMADHLRRHRFERDGQNYSAFPLEADFAERASLTFEESVAGEKDTTHLVSVLKGICDGALEHYLDQTLAPLTLNRLNRGVVSTARATIRKAAYSGIERGIPGLPTRFRMPVVEYFQGMLLEA